MGSFVTCVCNAEKVCEDNEDNEVLSEIKDNVAGNLLSDDSSSFLTADAIQWKVSLDPSNKKLSQEFLEDVFEISYTTSQLPISPSLPTIKAETADSSERLQPPVSMNNLYRPERNSRMQSQNEVICNWADAFEEYDSVFLTNHSSNMSVLQTDDNTLSENEFISLQDNTTSTSATVLTNSIRVSVEPEMVLAMCLAKDGYRFKQLNLNMSLEEVVDTFVSTDNKTKLPLSITESKKSLPKIMGRKQMVKTIAENIGPHIDVKTQGLIFSTGSVNSRLCHKVCLGDLVLMQKIISFDVKRQSLDD